jgi:hypothetical protein
VSPESFQALFVAGLETDTGNALLKFAQGARLFLAAQSVLCSRFRTCMAVKNPPSPRDVIGNSVRNELLLSGCTEEGVAESRT